MICHETVKKPTKPAGLSRGCGHSRS